VLYHSILLAGETADCGGESTCINGDNQYTCVCADGWTSGGGTNVECTNVDDCAAIDCGSEGATCTVLALCAMDSAINLDSCCVKKNHARCFYVVDLSGRFVSKRLL
jgi:hypothetical protein